MGILSKLFGSDSVVSAGISGIDKIVYTDEEKADAKLLFLKAYEPFKIAQRLIAMTVIPTYSIAWVATFVLLALDFDVAELLELLKGDMGTIVSIIIVFYFGGGAAEGIIDKFKAKPKAK